MTRFDAVSAKKPAQLIRCLSVAAASHVSGMPAGSGTNPSSTESTDGGSRAWLEGQAAPAALVAAASPAVCHPCGLTAFRATLLHASSCLAPHTMQGWAKGVISAMN